ncbi:MAG: hypothetical protein M3Q99_15475 [Acidobacteriota bacterium]|nr:hypothetical protein [Acidobacteriota bacterium]
MIIRQKQFEVLQEVADKNFVERIVGHLQEKHASLAVELPSGKLIVSDIPVETLHRLVSGGVAQAREYGITWETNLTSFVVMMFIASPNFHLHSAVNAILQDEDVKSEDRVDRLVENITEAEWQDAKESYDPQAWNLNA